MIREKRDDCMKRVYPVIFTETDNEVLIEVPDMEIMTQANDMYSSIEMARDAIGIKGISMEDDGQIIPEASSARSIDIKKGIFASEGKSVVSLVELLRLQLFFLTFVSILYIMYIYSNLW